ncbi:MAG: DUF547 domain-containing protein [Saprospiraceae bacterium]|nr:DUF547 domain-containing protein [Saprospiraceae bacterium]
MKNVLLVFGITLMAWLPLYSQVPGGKAIGTISHKPFNDLLLKYVTPNGRVNYRGLTKDTLALNTYLKALAVKVPDANWSRSASLAYWINAYNAFTLKMITDHYPINSLKDLHGGTPWDVKWIKLGEKLYSLNTIENDMIRIVHHDPRIHFALNCGAISCPPIGNIAFTESNVNELLDKQTTNFINGSANEISATKMLLSKIFDWYKADFGNITTFINKYSRVKVSANATLNFKEYNWALNDNL